MKRLPITLLTAGLLLVTAGSAAAAGTVRLSLSLSPLPTAGTMPASRSYFDFSARPGTTVRAALRIANAASTTARLRLYAVDGTTGVTSGAVYLDRTAPRRDVGAWITLGAPPLISVAPRATRVVRFSVRVPRGTRAGDHLGGIVAENTKLLMPGPTGLLRIRVRSLAIVAVVVHTPGGRCSLDVTRAEPALGPYGFQALDLRLRNSGEKLTRATGKLVVTTSGGALVDSEQLRLDTLVPGTSIPYPVRLGRVLRQGRYRAAVVLEGCGTGAGNRRRLDGVERSAARLLVAKTLPFTVSSAELAAMEATGLGGRHRPARGPLTVLLQPATMAATAVALVAVLVALRLLSAATGRHFPFLRAHDRVED